MKGRIVLLAVLGAIGAYAALANRETPSYQPPASLVAPSFESLSPEDWFAAVKADLKTARIAARQNNAVVLGAVAKSATTYRGQISAWTRVPSAANVYSACGDLVIAMADFSASAEAALKRTAALEDACRDAITPPIR